MTIYTFDLPQPIPADDAPITEISRYLENYSNVILDCANTQELRIGIDLRIHLERDFGNQPQLLHRFYSIF